MERKSRRPSRRGTTRRAIWGADTKDLGAEVAVVVVMEEECGRCGDGGGVGGSKGKGRSSSSSSSSGEGGRGSAGVESAMAETQMLRCLFVCVSIRVSGQNLGGHECVSGCRSR